MTFGFIRKVVEHTVLYKFCLTQHFIQIGGLSALQYVICKNPVHNTVYKVSCALNI